MLITTIYFQSTDSYDQAVVGESSYQAHIDSAFQEDGKFIEVALILEPLNKFDKNAVAISYGADTFGYLSREHAIIYRRALAQLGHPAAMGICKAKIIGGDGKHYGILLDLDIQNPQVKEIIQPKITPPPTKLGQVERAKSASLKSKSNKNLPLFIFISVLVVACVIIQMALQSAGIISTPATRTPYIGPLEELRLTKTAQAAESPTQTSVPTLDAYRTQLNEAIAKYQTAYDKFGELHLQLSNNMALLSDQEWRSGMSTALAELQFASDQLIALQSTSFMYDELDKQLKLLGSETKLMIQKYALALDTLDAAALSSVGDNLINITTYIQNATAELEKINNP